MTQPKEVTVSSSYAYRGRILALRVDTVNLPSARTTTREVVEHPGASVMVALNERGQIGLVRQFRYAIGRELLELPAGTREPPETAAECARRELGEELGLAASNWHSLLEIYSSPGFCTERLSVFVATSLRAASGHPEEDENLRAEWVDVARIPDLIGRGEICDAKSVAGLLAFYHQQTTGSAPWQG